MTPERHQEVFRIFEAACQLEPEAQREYLERHCAGDAALRAEVGDLLARDQGTASWLDRAALGTAVKAPGSNAQGGGPGPDGGAGEAPAAIGPYRLLSMLGEGGFGLVYVAEQTEPIRRRVAIKVIKPGMESRQVLARFEAERQALALMDHPAIARVLDAGAVPEGRWAGRPFFVMELVAGVPITEFCDSQRLTIPERLGLFLSVCEAVQHAHQKGVIHRDLKPANILVEFQDGRPAPKVIDFGVAKALSQPLTARTVFTEQGQLIGTPEYMSPEQANLTGMDIDTRTDVYALGVLLYELLTGMLPFEARSLRAAGIAEIQRVIREVEPPKPSTRLSSLGASAPDQAGTPEGAGGVPASPAAPPGRTRSASIAQDRRTDPRSLARLVRGDLDWIVMRAIEKERTRRYETASALAMEIRRYLAHEPVMAGPPSAAYRVRKFARRHRVGVGAGVAVAVALLAGLVASLLLLTRARAAEAGERSERVAAQESAARARSEAARAVAMGEFLRGLLSGVKPSVARGRDTAMLKEMLDEAAGKISERLAGQPEAEAAIRATMADVYDEIGELDASQNMAEEALRLRKSLTPEGREVLSAMRALAMALHKKQDFARAEPLMLDLLERYRELDGEGSENVAECLFGLGAMHMTRGDLQGAEEFHRRALEIRERVSPDSVDLASSLHDLGIALTELGRPTESEPLLRRSAEIHRRLLGEDHPFTATVLANLAVAALRSGQEEEAESLMRRCLEIRRKILPPTHPDMARAVNNVAWLLQKRGRPAEAEPLMREALDLTRQVWGEASWEVPNALNNLAYCLGLQGKSEEAEPLYRESLLLFERLLPGGHPFYAQALTNFAELLFGRDDLDGAEEYHRRALEMRRKIFAPGNANVASSTAFLAQVLVARGRFDEAESLGRETLETMRAAAGPEHGQTVSALEALAGIVRPQGRHDEAAQMLEEALAIRRRAARPGVTAGTLATLGSVRLAQGRAGEAETLLREALAENQRRPRPDPHLRCLALSDLGAAITVRAADDSSAAAEAETALLEAYRTQEAPIPGTRPALAAKERAATAAHLGALYRTLGRAEESREWSERAAGRDQEARRP